MTFVVHLTFSVFSASLFVVVAGFIMKNSDGLLFAFPFRPMSQEQQQHNNNKKESKNLKSHDHTISFLDFRSNHS
jgi:hypothetical protein